MKPGAGRIFVVEREEKDRSARTSGRILAPVMYSITGDKDYDCPFMGEVVAAGATPPDEKASAKVGDFVIASLFNIGHRLLLGGRPTYSMLARNVAGTLNTETYKVKPAQHYILVKPNLERAKRLIMGHSLLLLADSVVQTDDTPDRGFHAEYGEVVAVGPGQIIEGAFVKPECKPGDMVVFDASHSTVPVTIRGEAMALVSSVQVIGVSEKESEDEWINEVLRDRAKTQSDRERAESRFQ